GGSLLTLATRSWWSAAGTRLALAILLKTREGGVLLTPFLRLWLTIFFFWKKNASGKPIPIPNGKAITNDALVSAATARVFCSFARSEMTAPAFQRLYHSLLRINPAESKPYAPITMEILHRAFEVSPTFAQLRAPLDGPLGEAWRVESMRRTGTPNEIGVGW